MTVKMIKVEHPGLGATSYVPEDSMNAWGGVGWVISEDQDPTPDEIEAQVVITPVPNSEPVVVPEPDVTPVGDSEVEPPADAGTENAEG